ncbi:amidase-domain-containing protein [Tothia fuscella]|uniref:Glutamyl-tRNA(Gln) amidotransferase subunit A, mitochondrial n=1 Tax=Tothia fuscella TaxID=1048955 RepID=A0A9P4TVU3_9PEZI|nr:amidase-domain-containing protein [Tothia fuscella]
MPAITRNENVVAKCIQRFGLRLRRDAIGHRRRAPFSRRFQTTSSTQRYSDELRARNKESNAFIQISSNVEKLTKDERIPFGKKDLLHWQFAVKDNICTVDLPTTCASAILQDFQGPFDATVIEKMKKAGGLVLGKTNMDEFGMGSHSTYSHFGPVERKGKDEEFYSAGGSSGGSAAAYADEELCLGALGTDTGGSVRLPAAYNGVQGFKPSYGILSRWGVIPYANSLDTVGFFSPPDRSSLILDQLKGHDPKDPTSLSPYTRERIEIINDFQQWPSFKATGVLRLRIGVPTEYNVAELEPAVREAWTKTLQSFQRRGHEVVDISLPTTKLALSAYYVIAPAEASSNLAKYDGVRYGTRPDVPDGAGGLLFSQTRDEGFGDEVKRRILLGSYTLSADAIDNYFIQAQKVRRLVQQDFNRIFRQPNVLNVDDLAAGWNEEGVDVIVCPTAPTLPPLLEQVEQMEPLQAYTNDIFTVPASLAGLPAMSMPYKNEVGHGSNENIGIQIIGQFGMDELVCHVADSAYKYQGKLMRNAVAAASEFTSPGMKSADRQLRQRVDDVLKGGPKRAEGPQAAMQDHSLEKWRKDFPDLSLKDYYGTVSEALKGIEPKSPKEDMLRISKHKTNKPLPIKILKHNALLYFDPGVNRPAKRVMQKTDKTTIKDPLEQLLAKVSTQMERSSIVRKVEAPDIPLSARSPTVLADSEEQNTPKPEVNVSTQNIPPVRNTQLDVPLPPHIVKILATNEGKNGEQTVSGYHTTYARGQPLEHKSSSLVTNVESLYKAVAATMQQSHKPASTPSPRNSGMGTTISSLIRKHGTRSARNFLPPVLNKKLITKVIRDFVPPVETQLPPRQQRKRGRANPILSTLKQPRPSLRITKYTASAPSIRKEYVAIKNRMYQKRSPPLDKHVRPPPRRLRNREAGAIRKGRKLVKSARLRYTSMSVPELKPGESLAPAKVTIQKVGAMDAKRIRYTRHIPLVRSDAPYPGSVPTQREMLIRKYKSLTEESEPVIKTWKRAEQLTPEALRELMMLGPTDVEKKDIVRKYASTHSGETLALEDDSSR